MMFINGQGRKVLVNTTVVASNGALPTSIDFGMFLISECSGILGMIKADSNFLASLRFQYLSDEDASPIVTSALAITSGTLINELNPGGYVNIGVTGITSNTQVRAFLTGLPIR